MEIVIDSSAIIAVIANEPEKSALISATDGARLIAPLSIHFEIGNAFSAMLKRQRLKLEQALEAQTIYQSIPIRWVDVELNESLRIASQLNVYAYDAYLIRCAEKYHCPLLTLDRALRVHAQTYGVSIVEVTI
ncbi:MAG: type II toxin-antitoxin system VapC family toxin [Caldilinea sp.]|uniref:type II toxin-antitoxin system VapC family toxin n=1 Tax=Caldilinea sp. TaxID=2293560 RepID=UPI002C691FD9|nr:type II toxin-antitoxin system VapC family toxin [Anaerolineales bacterium]HQY92798.1 type II toxin-antitoxin system VapC family toxin [Caldilinea sp.]